MREAFFSDNYRIVWENRVGFARVAVDSKVVSCCIIHYVKAYVLFTEVFLGSNTFLLLLILQPVIPIFTQNCREAFRSVSWGRSKCCDAFQSVSCGVK